MLLGLSCISMLSPFNSEKKKKPQGFKARNGYKQKKTHQNLKGSILQPTQQTKQVWM